MAPKFRGGSDDWLDDEAPSSEEGRPSPAKKKGGKPAAKYLPLGDANATVAEVFPMMCRVVIDLDKSHLLCSYRRAEVLGDRDQKERAPVAAGDRVKVQVISQQDGVVEGICVRRNQLRRSAPDRDGEEIHVLASNIDFLAIVASVLNPEFSPGLIDRFMIAGQIEGIQPILILNKIDLFAGGEKPWELYSKLGIPIFELSAKFDKGLAELQKQIVGHTVVFAGHSGVGKTSLLNKLLEGSTARRVGEVNESTGKGRHTTTGAVLLEGPGQSQWIDTPGIREFALVGVEPIGLRAYFPEFHQLVCGLPGCLHMGEEDCQAVGFPRYLSYRRIYESLLTPGR